MVSVRKLLLSLMFIAGGFMAGCGSTDEIIISGNTYIPPSVGEVRLATSSKKVVAEMVARAGGRCSSSGPSKEAPAFGRCFFVGSELSGS